MARDPFANYDSWLERPYQDMYEAADHQEYIDEHTTYESECCGEEVDKEEAEEKYPLQQATNKRTKWICDWTEDEKKCLIVCPKCGEAYTVNKIEPEEYDGGIDYDEPDEDDRYFDS